jgi:hypothetical protein
MMLIEVTRNKGMRLQRQNALLIQGLLYQEAISKVCLLKTEIQNVDFFVHTVRSYEFLSYQPFIVVERTMMAVTGNAVAFLGGKCTPAKRPRPPKSAKARKGDETAGSERDRQIP